MNRQLAEEEGSGMRGLWAEDWIRTVYKKHRVSVAQTEEERNGMKRRWV